MRGSALQHVMRRHLLAREGLEELGVGHLRENQRAVAVERPGPSLKGENRLEAWRGKPQALPGCRLTHLSTVFQVHEIYIILDLNMFACFQFLAL